MSCKVWFFLLLLKVMKRLEYLQNLCYNNFGDVMQILYGGAFNPPTQAHFRIIEYLSHHYPNDELILLPANQYYKTDVVSFEHRQKMLELMIESITTKVTISNYEANQMKFSGTIETLRAFNHPLFVLGADQILAIEQWIAFPQVIVENQFLVFPRNGIDVEIFINNHPILQPYHNHFTMAMDFTECNVSSGQYRMYEQKVLTPEVERYINEHQLYKR